jgi:hypothetical protein
LLGGAGADDLVEGGVFLEEGDEFGDPLVGVGHVGVGPDHDVAAGLLGADPADGPRSAVAVEVGDLQVRELGGGLVQAGQGAVGGGVVEGQELVGVSAAVHGLADPGYLGDDVVLLVVAGQDDRDIRMLRGRNAHGRRDYYRLRGSGATAVHQDNHIACRDGHALSSAPRAVSPVGHGDGSDIQTLSASGQVLTGAVVRVCAS